MPMDLATAKVALRPPVEGNSDGATTRVAGLDKETWLQLTCYSAMPAARFCH